MTTANTTYRKNPAYSDNQTSGFPRLFAELDLSGFGIHHVVKSLPIYYTQLKEPVGPVRVIYSTRVAGLSLEAGNLSRLEEMIDDTLKSLIRFEKVPEYFFRVNDKAYPIYHLEDEITTRYPGGPIFATEDIASLRLWIADHFKAVGRIKNRREMELLYLSETDLQLYAPYCVLRTPDEAVPDIPIFPLKKGDCWYLIAPVSNKTICVDFAGGKGIFFLFSQVGEYLIQQGQLTDIYEITIRKLQMDSWRSLEMGLQIEPMQLVYDRESEEGEVVNIIDPIYSVDSIYISARTNRLGRLMLYLSPDLVDLSRRVDLDLTSYGAIKKNSVNLVALQPA